MVVEALLKMFAPAQILLSDNKVEDAEPPAPATQTPPTEKHPEARSIPPVDEKVVVDVLKFETPWMLNKDAGLVVPMPK